MKNKEEPLMKATGIVRRIDDLGRVVIPKEIRDTHGLKKNAPMEIFVSNEGIIFRPYKSDTNKNNALTWLENALSDATNDEDKDSIVAAISYVKRA
jgi:AbrB family transcriptional regulator, transcriptional pleiotropic regulator of transition state genes